MNCQDIVEILDDGDSQSLPAAERGAFDVHIAGCAECRAAFLAHEAMGAMAVPAMSPDLEAQCRRLVIARSAGHGRRIGGRPILVVGLLLAGAAAAAFLGLDLLGGSVGDTELPKVAVTTPDPDENANEPVAMPPAEPDAANAGPDESQPVALGAAGFTVGVSPLRQTSTNPEVIRISELVYGAFLEELRKLPNLEVAVLAAGELEEFTSGTAWWVEGAESTVATPVQVATSASSAVAGPPAGAIEFEAGAVANIRGVAPAGAGVGTGEPRTLVLRDSRRLIDPDRSGEVNLNAIPTALVGRIETVTDDASAGIGADAAAGVVNVILDNNIEGVRVDMSYSTTDAGDGAMREPLPYDVLLNVVASSRPGSNSWSFGVNARSRGAPTLSTSVGSEVGEPIVPSAFIVQLIATLQAEVFPVDASVLAAVTENVLDSRMPVDEWLSELNRLKQLAGRAGQTRLADEVALAIVDMSGRITGPRQLADFIRALEGIDNAVLVQPLGNALRNGESENIRLEAAIQLARFQEDPVARAALEAAAIADPSPEVRLNARWAALDDAGHRNLIVTTLLDTRLTDAERIEPLLLDLGWARIDPVDLGSAVDATVVNQLSQLLGRLETAATRARVLGRLSRENSQDLTTLFIERLRDDGAEFVRGAAATALRQRLDEPAARQALERAAVDDPSPRVRQAAAVSLGDPAITRDLLIRN